MLNIMLRDVDGLEQWHYESAKVIVDAKTSSNEIFKEYKENLEYYLKAPALEHQTIEKLFENIPRDAAFKEFTNIMIALYHQFSNKYGYELVNRIGLKTCPYCNRSFTLVATRANKKGVRPELDHFVPKSEVPALALNLYNLIPVCPSCNHLKKARRMRCNPYLREPSEVFKLTDVTDATSLKLLPENSDYAEVLLLDKLYAQHSDYIQEILDKAVAYNNCAYDALLEDFQAMAKTPAELNRMVWGVYLDDAEHHKRPLSKLTSDILKQLDIR